MKVFFEASALTKVYAQEKGSKEVRELFNGSTAFVSRISLMEVVSALSRKHREKEITKEERRRLVNAFRQHEELMYVLELTEEVTREAQRLLLQYVLRAGDAIQLATFSLFRKRLPDAVLVCFDDRLSDVAAKEGHPVHSIF